MKKIHYFCQKLFLMATIVAGSNLLSIQLGQAQEAGRPPICTGNPPTGQVKCNYEGGDNYVGSFVNGFPEGNGIYVYANRDRYEGQFRKGLPNGQGTFIKSDDTRYVGTFKDGQITSGTIIFPNGDRFVGQFDLVRNVANDEISAQPTGKGQFTFANGSRFEGTYFAGTPFGPGVFVHNNGIRCEGEFFNEALDGKGTCKYPNGLRYQGELRGGIPHGVGTITDTSGKSFPGVFRAGQRENQKK